MTVPESITSPANPRIKRAALLRGAAARRESGLTLVDGRREILRAAAAGVEFVELFLAAEPARSSSATDASSDPLGPLLDTLAGRDVRLATLTPRAFERIAFGARNEGVVAVVRFGPRPLADVAFAPDAPVLVVEGVEKPGNLGAILRTADATGMAGVIVCDGRTDVANPAVIRASLGTVFCVAVAAATAAETIAWCAAGGRRAVAAAPDGERLWHAAALAGPTALVLGSEAHGISPSWRAAADRGTVVLESVRLPMRGRADSLNLSATAAVLAYEAVRQGSGR